MRIIDGQVHIVGPSTPERPWVADLQSSVGGAVGAATAKHFGGDALISAEQMLAAMEAVGVFGAILVVSTHYGFDNRFSLDAAAAYPDRFRVVGKLDPAAPDLDDQVAEWRANPLTGALRFLVLSDDHRAQLVGGHFDRLLDACVRHGVPLQTYAAGHLDALGDAIRRFDGTAWIIDHLGLSQPPVLQADPEPFARLPQLLALADMPGVHVKLSGMPALSRQPYPYADLKQPFAQLLGAFGPDRLIWGSDWTRTKSLLPYPANVTFLDDLGLLSAQDKVALFENNIRRVMNWPA